MKLKSLALAVSVCAFSLATSISANAADLGSPDTELDPPVVDDGGLYLSVFGGVLFEDDFNSTIVNGPAAGATYSIDLDTGFLFGAAAGVELSGFASGFTPRLELELSYRALDVGTVNFSGNGPGAELNVAGDVDTFAIFANALADFDTGGPITPYVGVGLGVGFVDYNFSYQTGPLIVNDNGSDTDFAAQIIAGFSYELSENVDLLLDARYSRIFDVEVNRVNATAGGVLTGTFEDDIDNFAITTGLRIKF